MSRILRRSGLIGIQPAGLVSATPAPRLWTPADIPELTCWWDSDSGITMDGAGVSFWASKIGPGVFRQTDASSRPTLTSVNGVPALNLNGSNQRMELPQREQGATWLTPNPHIESCSYLTVGAPTAYSGTSIYGVSGGDFAIGCHTGGERIPGWIYSDKSLPLGPTRWDGTKSFCFLWDRGSAAIRVMGMQAGLPKFEPSPYTTGQDMNYYRGYLGYNSRNSYWQGTINALAMAPGLLSGIHLDRWEGYYAHKLGSTAYLSDNHPFKNSPPRVG